MGPCAAGARREVANRHDRKGLAIRPRLSPYFLHILSSVGSQKSDICRRWQISQCSMSRGQSTAKAQSTHIPRRQRTRRRRSLARPSRPLRRLLSAQAARQALRSPTRHGFRRASRQRSRRVDVRALSYSSRLSSMQLDPRRTRCCALAHSRTRVGRGWECEGGRGRLRRSGQRERGTLRSRTRPPHRCSMAVAALCSRTIPCSLRSGLRRRTRPDPDQALRRSRAAARGRAVVGQDGAGAGDGARARARHALLPDGRRGGLQQRGQEDRGADGELPACDRSVGR